MASRTRRRYCARFKSSKTPAPSRSAPLLARGAIDALIGSRKPDELGRHPDVAASVSRLSPARTAVLSTN
jgi:hypothetical protein